MLQIPCPYCGVRDEEEYRFGGESHVTRPTLEADDVAWADYLFNRINPKGVAYERWLHSYGCGRWFNVARDTVTHDILAVYLMGEAKPELALDEVAPVRRSRISEGSLS
ncbi:sarcosine oxidase subunit delta [Steroidobacter sp.]|uniref:sarcosine oxidase subunit delta n=1 Tax=Steroidobacter sp. TaxID=1978227 RepID=UPI001A5EDA73|nr:sarcosine oxidase subunit delta [Steroidobacter sp.]MBL8270258.1 sarcosine oxidase subunit delta [Steroidobacter sp.]